MAFYLFFSCNQRLLILAELSFLLIFVVDHGTGMIAVLKNSDHMAVFILILVPHNMVQTLGAC